MNGKAAATILVVEDERIIAHDLQQTLEELGYQTLPIASSAEEAIARAAERCPNLVLMDIRIKGKRDGIETATLLTEQFGVPVVYLTAHADDATLERAKRTEPHGYLLKPVKAAELRSTIEVALYRHDVGKRARERQRGLSSSLASTADAVIALDLSGNVTFMNPAAEQITGMPAAAGIGRPALDVMRRLPAGTAPREEAMLRQEDEVPRGAVMVFREVSEPRLPQARLELADRVSSLATFAAGVAHEVTQALAVVIPNAALVSNELAQLCSALRADPRVTAEQLDRLRDVAQAQEELRTAADAIGNTIRELAAFSRPAQPPSGEADVQRAIERALRSTRLEGQVRVSLEASPLPRIRGDESQLGQALAQLLLNASRASSLDRSGCDGVSISVRDDAHGHVVIEVRDSGAPILPELRARAFEPSLSSAASDGAGLGVAISHGIIRSFGGEIEVVAAEGRGNVFRIRLSSAAQTPPQTTAPIPAADRLPARILVVDDQPLVLRVVERMLRGHDVVCFERVRPALELLERGEAFDLILSDIVMPEMSGIAFYEALLKRDVDLARRVVFMSGGTLTREAEDFLRAVSNRRIHKPFTMASFVQKVDEWLAANPARAGASRAGIRTA